MGAVTNQAFIYDDSNENDVSGARPSDGPGTLRQFAGHEGFGPWLLTISSTNKPGNEDDLSILLERQQDLTAGTTSTLLPGACRMDFIYVPAGVSNLSASLNFMSGMGPVSWQLYPEDASPSNSPTLLVSSSPNNASLTVDTTSQPPINPGLYLSHLCNLG